MRLKSDNTQLWIVYASLRVLALTRDNHSAEELHCFLLKEDGYQLRTIHTGEYHLFFALLPK